MSSHDQYNILKREVVLKAGQPGRDFSLDKLKDHFKAGINSNRSLSRVKSLRDIILLLEERCILNENNVMPLHDMGVLLHNSSIKELVHFYNKMYKEGPDVCICGANCELLLVTHEVHHPPESSHSNASTDRCIKELEEALENIARRIGKKWCVLARELDIREYEIVLIRSLTPDNTQQAREMLKTWREKNNGNITLDMLDKALNARLCKLKGINSDLRNHVRGITY